MVAACDQILSELPQLPDGVPRSGSMDGLQSPTPQPRIVPFAPTDSAQLASEAEPPSQVPMPLRVKSQSEETFDFGYDPDLDPQPAAHVPKPDSGTLSDTPLHPQHHTAVPDITSSEASGDTASEAPVPRGWRKPVIAALLLVGIGLPAAWLGLRAPEPPVGTTTDASQPADGPSTEPGMTLPLAGPVPETSLSVATEPAPTETQDHGTSAEEPGLARLDAPAPGSHPEPAVPAHEPAAAWTPRENSAATQSPVKEQAAAREPEVEPPPPPPADPEPAAPPSPAHVSVQGEVDELRLIDSAGKAWPPGELPPGSYKIEALFPGGAGPIVAGKLELAPGQSHTLGCNATFKKCQ